MKDKIKRRRGFIQVPVLIIFIGVIIAVGIIGINRYQNHELEKTKAEYERQNQEKINADLHAIEIEKLKNEVDQLKNRPTPADSINNQWIQKYTLPNTDVTPPNTTLAPQMQTSKTNNAKNDSPDYILAMKMKCNEMGQQYHPNKFNPQSGAATSVAYTYNSKLNTCLYYWASFYKDNQGYNNVLLLVNDMLTNKDLLLYHAYQDTTGNYNYSPVGTSNIPSESQEDITSMEDFNRRKSILFNE